MARSALEAEKEKGAEPAALARLQGDVENLERRIEGHVSKSRRRAVRVRGHPRPRRHPDRLREHRWLLTLKLRSGDVVADAPVGEKGDVVFAPRKVRPTTEPK